MQPLLEFGMRAAGYETRVLELEGEDPGIVLFHGYADSADTWRPLLEELARAGRRALAVDLPGFGRASPLALPDARVELLEGVGHCPQLEATERIAELLLDFGGELERAA